VQFSIEPELLTTFYHVGHHFMVFFGKTCLAILLFTVVSSWVKSRSLDRIDPSGFEEVSNQDAESQGPSQQDHGEAGHQ
jgi:hypothetical protein